MKSPLLKNLLKTNTDELKAITYMTIKNKLSHI